MVGLRTMSIQKSSTINDDYLSVLVRCGGQCQLEAAPCAFVMAINFWFLLELKQKLKKTNDNRGDIVWNTIFSMNTRLTTQQSHTHMHNNNKKGERRMTIYFSLFSSIAFEMVKLAPVVDCAPGKSLFHSCGICRMKCACISSNGRARTSVNVKPRLIQLNLRLLFFFFIRVKSSSFSKYNGAKMVLKSGVVE